MAQRSVSRTSAVLVGSTVTFTCRVNVSKVCWTYGANISNPGLDADVCRKGYDDIFRPANRCSLTDDRTNGIGLHTLSIIDVRLTDAGFYSCKDCAIATATATTAHLLVLGETLLNYNSVRTRYIRQPCPMFHSGAMGHGLFYPRRHRPLSGPIHRTQVKPGITPGH